MKWAPHPDREAIRDGQLRRLSVLLQEVRKSNPFYRRKLGEAAPPRPDASLDAVLFGLPFTTKQELMQDQLAHPPFGSNLTYPIERYTRYSQTSTTSGTPLRWVDTPESWAWMVDNWLRVYAAAGVRPGDRIYFAFSFGPFIGFWLAFDAAVKLGCLGLPGGGQSSTGRLQAILDNEATVLCCTPTYALHLGQIAAREQVDLSRSRVRTILVAGEPGGSVPATRAAIERLWPGARVFDHHGMTEVGPVSYENLDCPGHLHVIESSFVAEVIDPDTLEPAAPETRGELVLTTLGRTGSPVIRYRTGDLVKPLALDPQRFGRANLVLEGGILARLDEMIIVRGANVYPSAIEEIVRRFEEITEYRVDVSAVGGMDELIVHVETSENCLAPEKVCHKLESALRGALSLRVPVQLAEPGSLPRFELKAKRWKRTES